MGIVAVTLYTLFFPGKDKEKGKPRDYQTIVESGILRAVTEYNSISYFADGDTVSGFHYELLNAFARSTGRHINRKIRHTGKQHHSNQRIERLHAVHPPHPSQQASVGAAQARTGK